MRHVEQQVRRGRVTLGRFGLQAAQDDFLQPFRQVGTQGARRHRVHPQPLAHAACRLGCAEGQLAGGQFVEDHADREDVTAGVAAYAHHLLGRDPGGRADGLAQFLGPQVGVMRMAGEPEIEKHRHPVLAHEHVGRLEVEVADVLAVQAVRSAGHRRAEVLQRGGVGPFGHVEPVLKRVAFDVLHHQIRDVVQVASGHKARCVVAGEHLHDLVLHLEAHDVLGTISRSHAGNLHRQRETRIAGAGRIVNAVDVGHAPRVNAVLDDKSVQFGSRFQQFQRPSSRRLAKNSGSPAALIAAAAD